MSKLGSLYIRLGEPDGEMPGCCETAEWAASEIERLHAALRHVVRLYMVDDLAYSPDSEVERIVQRLLSNALAQGREPLAGEASPGAMGSASHYEEGKKT